MIMPDAPKNEGQNADAGIAGIAGRRLADGRRRVSLGPGSARSWTGVDRRRARADQDEGMIALSTACPSSFIFSV